MKYVIRGIGIVGLAALILILTLTSPTEIGPLGVLVFFTTLYATLFSLFSMILQVFYRLAFKKDTLKKRDYLFAAIFAFGPIMVMMARSFGAINLWTLSLIALFLILAEFLVYKKV